MSIRNRQIPLVFALSLTLAAPAAMAWVGDGRPGVEQDDRDKKNDRNRNRNSNRNDNRGNRGGRNDDRNGNNNTNMDIRFRGMDRNNDGRITRAEWRGNDNSFRQHDWNGDGVLSGAEVAPGGRHGDDDDFEDRFDRLDRNDDGILSLAEWPGRRDVFERLDTDDNGVLTRQELEDGHSGGNLSRRERAFRRMDLDNDGRLSRSEWRGDLDLFTRLDWNRDAFVSLDEFLNRR